MVVKPTTASPLLGRWTTRYTSLVGLAMHTLSHRQTASHVSATRLRRMKRGALRRLGGQHTSGRFSGAARRRGRAQLDLEAVSPTCAPPPRVRSKPLPRRRHCRSRGPTRCSWSTGWPGYGPQLRCRRPCWRPPGSSRPRLGDKVAARLAGAQLGAALAFVATRILGQFDPYSQPGRLLLVAPNIVAAERAMALEPHGFRQWVCLHEQTHRAQFDAAPWLPDHLLGLMRRMFTDDEPHVSLLSAGQGATFDSITAVMSLLEGTPT